MRRVWGVSDISLIILPYTEDQTNLKTCRAGFSPASQEPMHGREPKHIQVLPRTYPYFAA